MNFENLITDSVGLVHTLTSVLAIVFGTWVLLSRKGDKRHKKLGYLYVVSMVVCLFTSFFMYNLFGGFGIFHGFAIVSAATLIGGMFPIILKKPKHYIALHFNFMYWSVIGLYGAFLAEILTRIPPMVIKDEKVLPLFFALVGVAIFHCNGCWILFYVQKKERLVKI